MKAAFFKMFQRIHTLSRVKAKRNGDVKSYFLEFFHLSDDFAKTWKT